jgi:hypothetical protein
MAEDNMTLCVFGGIALAIVIAVVYGVLWSGLSRTRQTGCDTWFGKAPERAHSELEHDKKRLHAHGFGQSQPTPSVPSVPSVPAEVQSLLPDVSDDLTPAHAEAKRNYGRVMPAITSQNTRTDLRVKYLPNKHDRGKIGAINLSPDADWRDEDTKTI